MTKGRLRLTFNNGRNSCLSSYRHQYRSSPVSFLLSAARFLRIAGAYVSWILAMRKKPAPLKIMTIQFVQRHPRYWYVKPPITGPKTGPFIGPIDHILNASARYFSDTISL